MLVDQHDANIFSFGESVKRRFDRSRLCLVVDDEEVLLCIGAGCDMLEILSMCSCLSSGAAMHYTYPDASQK
jgi:hypothetical protein